jgi:hypothetical protein
MFDTHTKTARTIATLVPLGMLAVIASFSLGVGTSGTMKAIRASSATEVMRGDVTLDNVVDIDDAIRILEVAQGYRVATPEELEADPNANGSLAVDDAIRVLRSLSPR